MSNLQKKSIFYPILIVLCFSFCLIGCNLLIRDESNPAESYPMEYEVMDMSRIEDFTIAKEMWDLHPTAMTEGELTLFTGLTNCKTVEIDRIQWVDREITIYLKGSRRVIPEVYRPRFKLLLKGINPYEKNKYTIHVKTNYPEFRLPLNLEDALSLIRKEFPIGNVTPSETKLFLRNNTLFWNLHFDTIVQEDDESPVVSLSAIIDVTNKNITHLEKTNISSKIDDGEIIGLIDDDSILFLSPEGELSMYSIPRKEILKLQYRLQQWDLSLSDPERDMLYLYSSELPHRILSVNANHQVKEYDLGECPPPFLLTVDHQGQLYFATYTGESALWKMGARGPELIQTFAHKLLDLRIHKNCFLMVWERNGNREIIKYDTDFRPVYIDRGTSPRFLDEHSFVYLKDPWQDKEQQFMIYSLQSGLRSKIIDGPFTRLTQWKAGEVQLEKDNGRINSIWTFQGSALSFIGNVPSRRPFYLHDHNVILAHIPSEKKEKPQIFLLRLP
ncbi:MAG: hypothetical protein Q4Q17_01460 [Tissierellia bacterium]|nr:hypothetical protein [Tissierellia bacterium]